MQQWPLGTETTVRYMHIRISIYDNKRTNLEERSVVLVLHQLIE